MATILVYNNDTKLIERYVLDDDSPMPYNAGRTLSVREFKARSSSNLLWTDKHTMQAFNITRARWGRPLYIGAAFKRIWEGGHTALSQHNAGTAFDVANNLSDQERAQLWHVANNTGAWAHVDPQYLTPTWVHFDKRFLNAACPSVTYPLLKHGSRNQYVMVLQDALSTLGYPTKGIDGLFGDNTHHATVAYQRAKMLTPDGIAGCKTWNMIGEEVAGIGRTTTTPDD